MNFKKVGLTVLIILLAGGRSINAQNLDYTTNPEEVQFGYSGFGSYQAISFMGNEYFAGYDFNTTIPNPIIPVMAESTLAQGQLNKVLIDDDTKRTISLGGTLTLQEGYALKAVDIDISASKMLIELLQNGTEIEPGALPLSAGETYVYAPRMVGVVNYLPIFFVHINDVNNTSKTATIDGIFQISEGFINVPTTTPASTATSTSIPTPIPTTPPQYFLTISKGVKDRMYLQNTAVVSIDIGNHGMYDIHDIHINDRLDQNFELISNTSFQWYIPVLKPGQEWGTTYYIKPLEASLDGFTIPAATAQFTVNGKPFSVSSNAPLIVVSDPSKVKPTLTSTPTPTVTPSVTTTITPTTTQITTPTPPSTSQLEQEVKELKERLNKTEERQTQQESRISWLESTVNSFLNWFKSIF